ncbi:MAG: hypothetical protein RL226_917 [Bacteroidota bacterium]
MEEKINTGLILLSATLAILLPFELFLFSYAALGPLHYLTEINWLSKRNFFIPAARGWEWIVLGVLCLPPTVAMGMHYFNTAPSTLSFYASAVVPIALLGTISWFVSSHFRIPTLVAITAVIILTFYQFPGYFFLITLLVPTLVHVYLFTLIFMVSGMRASKTPFARLNIALIVIVPLAFAFLPEALFASHQIPSTASGDTLGLLSAFSSKSDSLDTPSTMKLQAFIAFAYTYHYLNWFSKTKIIGWAKSLSRQRFWTVATVWACLLVVYAFNYRLGLTILFFWSLLHVFLEFPLNIVAIKKLFA